MGDARASSTHRVTLSWADYDHWSRGQAAPARVVEALVRWLIDGGHADLLRPTFDAAVLRRYLPDIDDELPSRL